MIDADITSENLMKLLLLLGVATLVLAGPLAHRIFSGETFGWFRDPRFRRLNKRQWQALRDKADRIIAGSLEVEAGEFQSLIDAMLTEITIYRRGSGSPQYSEDWQTIERLAEIFKARGYKARVEPYDSLSECLEHDGFADAALRVQRMVHGESRLNVQEFRAALLDALRGIRREHWDEMKAETRARWKESYQTVNDRPWRTLCMLAIVLVAGLGFSLYDALVRNKGFEFFSRHPVWLWGFAAYGVLVVALSIAALASYRKRRRRDVLSRQPFSQL